MSVERDSGFAALQRDDIATAIQQLEQACLIDPSDYEAHLYLGAAYGKANRHLDAINSVTKAVQLQPSNAQARYNLGIAMESGGYKEQAIQAMQQALTLQPGYTKAQEALQRLQPSAPPTQSPGTYATQPQDSQPGLS